MSDFVAAFTRASKLMRSAADTAMSRHGVRVGQNLVLETLWETDGQTPGEVAERLSLATPTLVKMASRMEASGLLTRRPDPNDRRLVRLYLTDRGRRVKDDIENELRMLERSATARLTPEECTQLHQFLLEVAQGLTEAGAATTHEPTVTDPEDALPS